MPMAKLAPQLRVVEGGNNSNAVTRLYKTIDDITRQMKIRRDEAIKGNISLKNSYYTDKFYGGSKFKSPKIADISWLLTIRFLEKSWTAASLVTRIAFIIATDTRGNILVMYTIDDEGLKINFKETDIDKIDIEVIRETQWRDAEKFVVNTQKSDGSSAIPFSPEHLFAHSMETPQSNIIRVISMACDQIRRNIEHHSRYNFLCKTVPTPKNQRIALDVEDINHFIDDEERKKPR